VQKTPSARGPAVIALMLSVTVFLASCGGGEVSPSSTLSPGGVSALPVLKAVGESLPRYPALAVDEEYIYTGGEETESLYWSHDPPEYLMHFFWESLPAEGWSFASNPAWTQPSPNDKDGSGQAGTWSVSKSAFRLEITVTGGVQKDPQRGTTRLGIRIIRTDPSATAPPDLPTPSPVEPGI